MLLSIVEFTYNNTKNASIGYMPFKLNYGYHLCIFYEEDVKPYSRTKAANKLTKKLKNLMSAYRENLEYAQELQKQSHDKGTKPRSYVPREKVGLNSKYIKTECNRKLEAKFFRFFRNFIPSK